MTDEPLDKKPEPTPDTTSGGDPEPDQYSVNDLAPAELSPEQEAFIDPAPGYNQEQVDKMSEYYGLEIA